MNEEECSSWEMNGRGEKLRKTGKLFNMTEVVVFSLSYLLLKNKYILTEKVKVGEKKFFRIFGGQFNAWNILCQSWYYETAALQHEQQQQWKRKKENRYEGYEINYNVIVDRKEA